MTSIIGIASAEPRAATQTELDSMLRATCREPGYRVESRVGDSNQFAIARVSHENSALAAVDFRLPGIAHSLTLFGDVYALPGPLATHRGEHFLRQYAAQGARFLSEAQGAFIAVMHDQAAGILTLVNDRFGQRPLYYSMDAAGVLRYSTTLAALFAAGVPAKVSATGFAQFFTYGQYFGCDTLYEDIYVLPAGSILQYDTNSGELEIASYIDPPSASHFPKTVEGWCDAITQATLAAVQRCSANTTGLGVALSGGLDARTLLGLIDHRQVTTKTICLGMPGSLDLRCAQQMADIVGCEHYSYHLNDSFLNNFETHLNRMVDLTGGQYLSQCIVMPTLPIYRELGIRVLLRGHAGELMHMGKAYAYSIDEAALAITTMEQAREWLFTHLQAYMLEGVEGELFQGEYAAAMRTSPRESLESSLAKLPALDDPRQAIWHFFVNERLRRETTLSLGKFASVCDVRVPLLDAELVPLLLAAPVELKLDDTLQRYILARCRPEFLSVINANIGAPMTAGRVRRKLAEFKMRAFGKLGLPGYQPYERTGLWLRRELAPLVERILLDEQCLERGVFQADTLRRVISNHNNQTANHTYLILAMLVFEIAQQRHADQGLASHDRQLQADGGRR